MSSPPASSIPWRSIVGLALLAPTVILIVFAEAVSQSGQNTSGHVSPVLIFGVLIVTTLCTIGTIVLGSRARATDPYPLAITTIVVGSVFAFFYALEWLQVLATFILIHR
jgi:hypothetical protein